jgi:hypothetical protein
VLLVDGGDDDGEDDAARRDVVEDLGQRDLRIRKEDVDAQAELPEPGVDFRNWFRP